MKYDQLTTIVRENTHLGSDYYALLIDHREDIIAMVDKYSQAKVADDLNTTQPKLSAILNILKLLPSSTRSNYIDENLKF